MLYLKFSLFFHLKRKYPINDGKNELIQKQKHARIQR